MPVMIHGTGGGGTPITDATAIADDVLKGKVFYNNDGRHVGTLNGGIRTTAVKVPSGRTDTKSYGSSFYIDMASGSEYCVKNYWYGISGSLQSFYTLIIPNNIISLKVDSIILYGVSMVNSLPMHSLHILSDGINYPGIYLSLQGNNLSFFALYQDWGGESPFANKTLTVTYY